MKRIFLHNFGLKLLSIVLAALLWLTIMNNADPLVTATINNIPVQIINDEVITSRGYQYSVESGEVIGIKVKGNRSVVDSLTAEDFVATADFNTLSSMYMAAITVECLAENSQNLSISLKNENMAVKLEDQETEPYSIRVVQEGSILEGYYCYNTRVSSTLIQVTGSHSQMEALKEVVAVVDVDGKYNSFSSDCDLIAYDYNGNAIDLKKLSFSQDSVAVTVEICPTKQVALRVDTVGEPADGYYLDKVEFAPSSVLVAAPQEILDELDEIVVELDITQANKDMDTQLNLLDYLYENYSKVFTVGDNITVGVIASIKSYSARSYDMTLGDIEVRGLAEGLTCTIYSMSSTLISVQGKEEELDRLTTRDLRLYIDLSDCTAGTYSRTIKSDYGDSINVAYTTVMLKVSEKAVVSEEE